MPCTALQVPNSPMSHVHLIQVTNGWIVVETSEFGLYWITAHSVSGRYGARLHDEDWFGYCCWDEEVVDLDAGNSDESDCLGISLHLEWKEVTLTNDRIYAPNLERLKEALQHVTPCAYCYWDI